MSVILSYQDPAPIKSVGLNAQAVGGRLITCEGKVLQFVMHESWGICAVLLDLERKHITMRSLKECKFVREESGLAPSGPLI